MIISIEHQRKTYKIETSNFIDLSIPYNFNGPQPNFYDVNPGKLSPYRKEGSSYSVSDGAGCNVPEINMNIHCTGTHTEYVGHLLEKNGSLMNCIQDIFLPTALLSVKPRPFTECTDGYHVDIKENEKDAPPKKSKQ